MASRFAAIPRVQFGRQPAAAEDQAVVESHVGKALVRRTAALAGADAILSRIPAPGEALHGLLDGRSDLMALIVVLIGRVGHVNHLRLATLSYSTESVEQMMALLDSKQVDRLTLICSTFFRDHNKAMHNGTADQFRDRGQRIAAVRSHAKLVCLDGVAGKLVCECSANLRNCSGTENFALIRDDGLHDFRATWIDAMVDRHEGEGDGVEGK